MKSIIAILVLLLCVVNGFCADAESHIYLSTYKVKKRVVLTIHLTSQYSLPSGTYNVQINGSPLQNLTSFSHSGGVIDRTISGIAALTLTQPDSSVPSSWNRVFVQLNRTSNGVNYPGYGGRVFTGERKEFAYAAPSNFETETVYETLYYVVGTPPANETLTFTANVNNQSPEAVQVRLKIDGEVVKTDSVAAETARPVTHTQEFPVGQGGDYVWEVYNPVTGEWLDFYGGEYAVIGDGLTQQPSAGSLIVEAPVPEPTPTPTPTPPPVGPVPSPPPFTPPSFPSSGTTSAPGSPAAVPRVGGGSPPPESEDIYAAVKAALMDAANLTTEIPESGGDVSTMPEFDKTEFESLGDGMKDLIDARNNATGKMGGLINAIPRLEEYVPRDLGTVSVINLGQLGDYTLKFDLVPYLTTISIMRQIILFFMAIAFLFMCMRLISDYLRG